MLLKQKPNSHRWLYPGLGLKRWAVLGGVAIAFVIIGGWSMVNNQYAKALTFAFVNFMQRSIPDLSFWQGLFCAALGLLGVVFCMHNFISHFNSLSRNQGGLDTYYDRSMLSTGPKIVVIGGGTGLSVLLKGLKHHTSNITAVVSVGDDGGSSGRLRKEFNVIPVGDIRSCIVALADEEDIMEKVFNYRFSRGEGLKGHSLGNLLLIAMSGISGNFQDAVANADQILHMGGRVLPITMEPLVLKAERVDGSCIIGECNIGETETPIKHLAIEPPSAQVLPSVLEAIDEADAIILGPGSLYTSIIPNLCVHQVVEAIKESQAKTFYICNVTTQPGETTEYTAADHLQAIYDHSCPEMIDYMLVDDGKIQPDVLLADVLLNASERVHVDYDRLEKMDTYIVETSLVSEKNPYHHDAQKLAQTVMDVIYGDEELPFGKRLNRIFWKRLNKFEKEEKDEFL